MQEWCWLVADWESFYHSKGRYSLRVMDTPSYILDHRFEEIVCTFKENGGQTFALTPEEIPGYLARLRTRFKKIAFISHNILFDACIACWKHGFVADLYVDTLSMSRTLLGHILARRDLGSVAKFLGLEKSKGTTVHKVDGMTRAMIHAAGIYPEYVNYCADDTDLCWGVFEKLYPIMPAEEVLISDMVHRMAIIPTLRLDRNLLAEHLSSVKAEKQNLLASCGLDTQAGIDTLMSNDQFAAMLTRMGVDPPTKLSPTTGKETWAFAKSDQSFKELLEHDDPMVQAVVAARIGVKTTLEESRTERFLGLCNLTWPLHGVGLLPVALKVGGAHTHRLSGDWKMNTQNFRRASRKYPRAMLRESVVAPEGYVLLVGDSKQIECRTEAEFLGQQDLVAQFANGEDPYSIMATAIFGYPVDKTKIAERFCGKTCLGGGTQVLTLGGWKLITNITPQDKLWDGVEWVSHDGLLLQGLKETQTQHGLEATADHEILVEGRWLEWRQVRTSPFLFQSALASANLPSKVTAPTKTRSVATLAGSLHADAHAGGKEWLPRTISALGEALAATPAANALEMRSSILNTVRPCRMTTIAPGFLTVSLRQSLAAIRQLAKPTNTTAFAGSAFTMSGAPIDQPSWPTSRLYPVGTIPLWKWIVKTTTAITSRAISVLLPAEVTYSTAARSRISSSECESLKPVYDIANAGPRQRFTVLTSAGPVIVHNCVLGCGYQLWWPKYQASIKHLSEEQTGTALVLTDEQAEMHVRTYRRKNHNIVAGWKYAMEVVIPAMTDPNCDFMWGPVRIMHEKIVGPTGLCLHYKDLHRTKEGEWLFTYGNFIKKIYGGKLVENIVQFLARCSVMQTALYIKDQMAALGAWFCMQAHDELVYCIPQSYAEHGKAALLAGLRMRPVWMPGVPLDGEVSYATRYGLAK